LYPVLVYETILPDFIERGRIGNECYVKTIFVRICLHPLHAACHGDAVDFTYPIDRCPWNSFLPKFEATFEQIENESLNHSIDAFIAKLTKETGPKAPEEVILSLAGQVQVIETGQRTNPAIDHQSLSALLAIMIRLGHAV
jgi:hypothetical protein